MDSKEFLSYSAKVSDMIVNYLENIKSRPVVPNVKPGFLKHSLPTTAPELAESMDDILIDLQSIIMPGVTHWQHPHFYAYFPAGNSFPSIIADMISDAIGCVGFSWAASPSCTELELIMLDWLAKMIGLPDHFLFHHPQSIGGGVLQGSASECILVSMLTARNKAIERLKLKYPNECPGVLLYKLVAYCSNQAHCAMAKAAQICFINLRSLNPDENYSLGGKELETAIQEDVANGLFPFMALGTLGTTSVCSFDNILEIGDVCKSHEMWFHIDAAYAGSAFICPELRTHLKGIECADSFNMNPNKWMLMNFDCSAYWVKDRIMLINTMNQNPTYLQHKNSESSDAVDYRHWGISLSRRFRSLKLWFVIRRYGITGIQKYIRNHIQLAKLFESLVRQDARFEICGTVELGLVCFRLKAINEINKQLLDALNDSGKIHMVPATLGTIFVLRFAVCRENAEKRDIIWAWNFIQQTSTKLLENLRTINMKIATFPKFGFNVSINLQNIPNYPTFFEVAHMCCLSKTFVKQILGRSHFSDTSGLKVKHMIQGARDVESFLKDLNHAKIIYLQCMIAQTNLLTYPRYSMNRTKYQSKNDLFRVSYEDDTVQKFVEFLQFGITSQLNGRISEQKQLEPVKNGFIHQKLMVEIPEEYELKKFNFNNLRKNRRSITEYSKIYNPCVGNIIFNVDKHNYILNNRTYRAASIF